LRELEDDDDDLEEGEERIHGKSTSPGPSVKFSDENLYKKVENEDIDYRFVRRKVDNEDDDDDEIEIDK
uniref:SPT6_acidic domain-containing protein n=2 Tax=Hymenolepis diminuta TaxID=6216 RepID=A0A0R3SZ27_HYMDI